MKRKDLTGKRKGRIVITSYSHSYVQPSGQKRAMWDFLCDCGNSGKISTTNFTHGQTISCGCFKKEGLNRKPFGMAAFNSKYAGYRIRAKNHKKNLEFSLTREQFRILIESPCHYCGVINSCNFYGKKSNNGNYVSNGIDRIDSNIGYVIENCVPCCTMCNKMKLDLPYNVFFDHIKRILNHASFEERD